MRIIAGTLKGRNLQFKSKNLRPTSDKVREALFNILVGKIHGANFLDLFAGSGALGIEALSRGAQQAVFVEKYPQLVLANIADLNLKAQTNVIRLDVIKALDMLSKQTKQFDVIFLDPPYDSPALELTLTKLGEIKLLAPEGLVIVEHRKQKRILSEYGKLKQFRIELYGETELGFYHLCP